jgi:transcriptional regulator with XRE-family HTH domain
MVTTSTTFDQAVGVRVRRLRSSRHLTQEQLAQHLSLARTSVTNIEAGRQPLSAYLMWRLADILACPIEDLLPRPDELASADERQLPTDLTPRSRDVINRLAGTGS